MNVSYDVLARHHAKNRAPVPPSQHFLNTVNSGSRQASNPQRHGKFQTLSLALYHYTLVILLSGNSTRHVPRPQSTSPHDSSAAEQSDSQDREDIRKRTRTVKDNVDDPTLLNFYPHQWKSVLGEAKLAFRLHQILSDPYPSKNNSVNGICLDAITQALAFFADKGWRLEKGK